MVMKYVHQAPMSILMVNCVLNIVLIQIAGLIMSVSGLPSGYIYMVILFNYPWSQTEMINHGLSFPGYGWCKIY